MKQLVATLLLIASFSMAIFAQKKEEINFSDPLQVDSSAYFLIPRLVDDVNKDAYGKGKGYLPWGNYSEIFFYNAATKQTKKLFDKQLALIQPFSSRRNYYENLKEPDLPPNILPNHIVYIARTDNFNGDNGLDNEDPQYLYISTKTGDNLRQVTPKGMNVISWTLSKDKKMILVKAQRDKNGNKKFGNGDDELYYRVDLQDDISKIQCEPLPM
ncbi:MAG: hypothetical protein ACXWWD_14335 [Chitinophagaceae bacterium]